jgi:exo-beta-1,3-glucanase (GH17 family)
LRDTTNVANAALRQVGISGVITTVHSTNSFFASTPAILESQTVKQFGYITVDSYPEGNTTNPAAAARARVDELRRIENLWHVPILIGEMGYSNSMPVDDATQQAVLQAEFDALAKLSYVVGLNYWVGAGDSNSGGYTHIFTQTRAGWELRPAAYALAAFFKEKS